MIFESAAAGVIGVLAGFAVHEAVFRCYRGRFDGERWLADKRVDKKTGRRGAGVKILAAMPAMWSEFLLARFGDAVRAKMIAAGVSEPDPAAHIGERIILAAAGFVGVWLLIGGVQGLVVGMMAGYGLQRWPERQLKARISARRLEISRSLPECIDLLAIAVEAGLGVDRAIRLYCDKFDDLLSEVFDRAMAQIELGKARRLALKEAVEANQSEELAWFVTALSRAEKLGSPMANALKEQAAAGRRRQSELVKELSATAPIRMLFPIAGLILPSLLIVIIGPVFLQLIR